MEEQQEIMQESFNWIGLVDSLKWPVLILVVIIILIKPIKSLINRVTKVGYGDKTLEVNQQTATQKLEKQENSLVDRVIGLFRPESIEMFANIAAQDTELEKLETDKDKIERLKKYSTMLRIMRQFDLIYYSIFGSQIRILEKLNTLQPSTKDSLKIFYEHSKNSNPNFFENYSFDDYLNFLFSFNLIIENDGAIRITILGVDFLKYLSETNKDVNKLN